MTGLAGVTDALSRSEREGDAVRRRIDDRMQGGVVSRTQGTREAQGALFRGQPVTVNDEVSVRAALSAGRMRPNVAGQQPSGVNGRQMPGSGAPSQAEFGNPMSRFRQVMEPGLTREERRRRMQDYQGMDERAAGRAAGLGQARIQADGAVGAAAAEADGKVRAAQEEARGSIAAALAGKADADGDGRISDKERVAYAEKLAKLDQDRFVDSTDPDKPAEQRPMTKGEEVYATELSRALGLSDRGRRPQVVDPEPGGGFDEDGAFPVEMQPAPRGQVIPPAGLQPGQAYVARLREMKGNPDAVAAFERRFGRGSAAQYLQ